MAVRGDLSHFHPIEVLQLLLANKETGILLVDTQESYIGFYFVEGGLAFGFVGERSYDFFTQKMVRDFVAAVKTRNMALFMEMLGKVKDAVNQFMAATKGTFSFEETRFFVDDEVKDYVMKTERIIVAHAKRIEDEEILSRKISSDEMVFRKSKNAAEILTNIELDADDYRVLDAVDGKKSVKEIVGYTGLPPIRVKQRLYGFLCAGVIQRAPQRIFSLSDLFSVRLITRLINRLRGL